MVDKLLPEKLEEQAKDILCRLEPIFGFGTKVNIKQKDYSTDISLELPTGREICYRFPGYNISVDDIVANFIEKFPNYKVTPWACKEEGIKYDNGKPRMCEMIQDFAEPLEEVAKVWAFGADKYSKGNWRYVLNGKDRYSNALIRHLLAEETQAVDLESGLYHAAHVAWNALARLYFIKKKYDSEVCKSED